MPGKYGNTRSISLVSQLLSRALKLAGQLLALLKVLHRQLDNLDPAALPLKVTQASDGKTAAFTYYSFSQTKWPGTKRRDGQKRGGYFAP
ncbi:hypothetical protein ABZT02_45500 [Streptomyces sp. NPDC005402]|uniref:hypothetical protein n=1 Tax=Streptomyces sp. NPDC005402 TaxID=3155338 RepID=UPI0033ADE17C